MTASQTQMKTVVNSQIFDVSGMHIEFTLIFTKLLGQSAPSSNFKIAVIHNFETNK